MKTKSRTMVAAAQGQEVPQTGGLLSITIPKPRAELKLGLVDLEVGFKKCKVQLSLDVKAWDQTVYLLQSQVEGFKG